MKQTLQAQAHPTLDTSSGVDADTIDFSDISDPHRLAKELNWSLTGDETTHRMMRECGLHVFTGPQDPKVSELLKELQVFLVPRQDRSAPEIAAANQLLKSLCIWRDNCAAVADSGQPENLLVTMALNSDRRTLEAALREFILHDSRFSGQAAPRGND